MRGAALVMAALLAGAARADVVETHEGRKIEGKVIEETASVVKIQTKFGTIEVPRANVKRITKGETVDDLYARKRAAAKSASDWVEVARWCAERGLRKEAREGFERAAALDPTCEEAQRALGRVKDGDEWVTLEERKRREGARERAALESKGLVEFGGRWVTPEEKANLEKGLVKVGDRWLSKEDAERARGNLPFGGAWVPAKEVLARLRVEEGQRATGLAWTVHLTPRVASAGPVPRELAERVAEAADRAFAALDRLFGGDGTGSAVNVGAAPPKGLTASLPAGSEPVLAKAALLVECWTFDLDPEYAKLVDLTYAESRNELAPSWPESAKRSFGGFVFHPAGRSLVVARGRDATAVAGHHCHNVAHVVAHRYLDGPTFLPPWYDEALAVLAEDAARGAVSIFCSVKPTAGTGTGERNASKKGLTGWRDALRAAKRAGALRPLSYVTEHDLFDLTTDDVLLAASVLEYLASRGDGSLTRLHGALQRDYGYARVPADCRERQRKCFEAAVKTDVRGLEALWERWFAEREGK